MSLRRADEEAAAGRNPHRQWRSTPALAWCRFPAAGGTVGVRDAPPDRANRSEHRSNHCGRPEPRSFDAAPCDDVELLDQRLQLVDRFDELAAGFHVRQHGVIWIGILAIIPLVAPAHFGIFVYGFTPVLLVDEPAG